MPDLRVLSGDDVMKILEGFGFSVVGQKGSHIKLRKISSSGERQTLLIPKHLELDRGTLRGVYRQALQYISEDALRKEFYSE